MMFQIVNTFQTNEPRLDRRRNEIEAGKERKGTSNLVPK